MAWPHTPDAGRPRRGDYLGGASASQEQAEKLCASRLVAEAQSDQVLHEPPEPDPSLLFAGRHRPDGAADGHGGRTSSPAGLGAPRWTTCRAY